MSQKSSTNLVNSSHYPILQHQQPFTRNTLVPEQAMETGELTEDLHYSLFPYKYNPPVIALVLRQNMCCSLEITMSVDHAGYSLLIFLFPLVISTQKPIPAGHHEVPLRLCLPEN